MFDVQRPGNDEGTRLHTTPSKKTREGLKGKTLNFAHTLLLCHQINWAFRNHFVHRVLPRPNKRILRSWDINHVTLQHRFVQRVHGGEDTDMGRLRRTEEQRVPGGWSSISTRRGNPADSKSQLKFNPTNPSILYASFRRSSKIYSWDIRGDTSVPLQIFQVSDPAPGGISNQKLMFDIDYAGRWLGAGDHVRRVVTLKHAYFHYSLCFIRWETCISSTYGVQATQVRRRNQHHSRQRSNTPHTTVRNKLGLHPQDRC